MAIFGKDLSEEEKRNHSFETRVAIREATNRAFKGDKTVSYRQAVGILFELSPELAKETEEHITRQNENDVIKLCRELAQAETSNESEVEIVLEEILKKRLTEYQEAHDRNPGKHIKKQIAVYVSALNIVNNRKRYEHNLIHHDFNVGTSIELIDTINKNEYFKDYKIDNNNILRLRLTHLTEYEFILGTDLIYEQYDLENELVRFAHVQYKTWDGKKFLLSDKRMLGQLSRMSGHLCEKKYCTNSVGRTNKAEGYRFPYCCGYLRPTDNLLSSESGQKTSGIYVPICDIEHYQNIKDKAITKQNSKERTVSYKIFDELFNSYKIGSKWFPISQLEDFYSSKKLLHNTESIIVRAQDIILKNE